MFGQNAHNSVLHNDRSTSRFAFIKVGYATTASRIADYVRSALIKIGIGNTTTTTLTADGTSNIYSLQGTDIVYAIARTVWSYWYQGTIMVLGQQYYNDTDYRVYRGTPLFDFSAISGTIMEATLKLTGSSDNAVTDFNLQIREYTEDTLSWDTQSYIAYGDTSFGSINSSDFSTDADDMSITFNDAGITYLNSKIGGNCYLMLVSDRDMSATIPTGMEHLVVCSGEHATPANRPHLTLIIDEGGLLGASRTVAYNRFASIAIGLTASASRACTYTRSSAIKIGCAIVAGFHRVL